MEIKIRRACAEDLKHILHHRVAMFEEMRLGDAAVLNRVETVSREYFTEALRAGTYLGWMAEDSDGQVVGGGGIVVADWPGFPGEHLAKRAWILNMYTEPTVRRHGVARKLMQAMIEWCRNEGFDSVSLHASEAGRPLYASMGFQPTNEARLKLR
ncbi:MAG TPA: GNAT family N-acetyltransferase [Candidatus Acidoferrum sp.]|nr:GNAT family N-acetyltransferase [Candidatus Acidoferrum sp.]